MHFYYHSRQVVTKWILHYCEVCLWFLELLCFVCFSLARFILLLVCVCVCVSGTDTFSSIPFKMILVGSRQIISGWLWLEDKLLVQCLPLRLALSRHFMHLYGKDISCTGSLVSLLLKTSGTKINVLSRFSIWLSLKFFVYFVLLLLLLLLLFYCKQNRDDSP